MPDTVDTTIYKLEVDGSQYIPAIDKLAQSTEKLSVSQEYANKTLEDYKKALASQSEYLQKAKKDLDSYSGSNAQYRTQLQNDYKSAQTENKRLIDLVNQSKIAYDKANAAAADYAATAGRANNLQANTTGGKIPTPATIATTSIPQQINQQILGVLNVPEFVDQSVAIQKTKAEFDDLRTSITLADARLQQLNKNDEEFKALAPIVEKGKEALLHYDEAAKLAVNSTERLRTQILQGRDSLARLEQAGKQNTKEYIEQRDHLAALNREYRIAEAEVNVLASQTRAIDFGKAAVESAINGFQIYTSLSILAGKSSEELQKKTMQLFAAMQLLTAMEQLANAVKKGGVIYTNLQSAAQTIYTAVVETSTGALKAFRIALATTGIGALIVGLGIIADKMGLFGNRTDDAKLALEELDNEIERSNNILQSLGDAQDFQGKLLLARMKARGATQKELDDQEIKNMLLKEVDIYKSYKRQKDALDAFDKETEDAVKKFKSTPLLKFTPEDEKEFRKQRETASKSLRDDTEKKFKDAVQLNRDIQLKQAETTSEITKKQINDDFETRKAALLEQIANLAKIRFESEKTIEAEYAAKLKKAILDINKDKTTTGPEKKILIGLAGQLNKDQLNKALQDYHDKVIDAEKRLNEELFDLQSKANRDSLNLIQDDFDKRAKLIEFNQANDLALERKDIQDRLEALDKSKLLLSEEEYQNAKAIIVQTGEQKVNNIIQKYNQERQQLSFDTYKKLGDQLKSLLENQNLDVSRETLIEINKQNDLLAAHTITFEQYQKNITDISKRESDKRTENEIENLRKQINLNTVKLSQDNQNLTQSQRQELIDQIRKDEQTITDLQTKNATQTTDPNSTKKVDSIAAYAQAIGQVAQSVIAFWQVSNDAEAKALDRSIALQQTRVDAAQRIADRGNAQYLKAEKDRLTELNLARENNARKQLGINAALQASEILVGIAGAIADIATPGIGVAKTITDIGVIIGAIATGYGIVKSLSTNQPTFFEGSPFVSRGTYPAGRDTIPAMINEGEAIIPTAKNKDYHPAIRAIYDGTIPAEHLNAFVQNYHSIKPVPKVNSSKIKDLAELHIGENGRMAVLLQEQNKKLEENNHLQRLTLRAMKNMSVSASIDKNGVAISVNEVIQKMIIDKKV